MGQSEAQAELEKFVDFYAKEMARTGFRPDSGSTRDGRVEFLAAVLRKYCHPYWMMKRGDPGRPISDEVVVWVKDGPQYRYFSDFIVSGGSDAWRLNPHIEGYLPPAQPLVSPLMPLPRGASTPGSEPEPLAGGEAPRVPGCAGPPPDAPEEPEEPPKPTYPTYEELGGDAGAMKITRVLEADYKEAGRPGLDGDCGAWIRRTDYDFLVGICASVEESIAKHRNEWRDALGLPRKR